MLIAVIVLRTAVKRWLGVRARGERWIHKRKKAVRGDEEGAWREGEEDNRQAKRTEGREYYDLINVSLRRSALHMLVIMSCPLNPPVLCRASFAPFSINVQLCCLMRRSMFHVSRHVLDIHKANLPSPPLAERL